MRRWMFPGAVAVSLAFGAAQAFASTAEARDSALACETDRCRAYCMSQPEFSDGVCVEVRGQPHCFCLF
jgi:hypothetical protein